METLRVRDDGDVLRVVFDRPHRQNAINDVLLAELHAVLDRAERSPECRIVTLSGNGGVFCTGMDFADATSTGAATDDLAERGGRQFLGLLKRLTTVPRVVVSIVDGRVAGGGVGVAAASDFVYASGRSTFGLPEALWGLLPCCVLPFLVRRVGFQPASAMTMSTLPVPAGRAHQLHLVDEVADDAEPALRRLRMRLRRIDPDTIADLKAYLRGMWALSDDMERAAVTEFSRLMSTGLVRDRIAGFASNQVLPWEPRS
jgi:polyketide biosynthesis enoyl-CoA hydratase PksH